MRGDTAIAKSDLQLGIDCRQPFSKKEEGRLYWHSLKKR
jgi:magnesium chelatase family protein